jgi:hypothetical protein
MFKFVIGHKYLACLSVFMLGGCSLIPDYSLFNDLPRQQEKSSVLESNRDIDFYNDDLKVKKEVQPEELKQEFKELQDEWKGLRPSINRLAKLESELSYIVEQLGISESKPTFVTEDDLNFNRVQSPMQNGTTNEATFMSDVADLDKFAQSLEVNPAPPVVNLNKQVNRNEGVNQNKFGGILDESSESNLISSLEVNDNKFSSDNFTDTNMAVCGNAELGKSFSMHVASFKKKTAASDLLRRLKIEQSVSKTCEYPATVAQVEVNGTIFYSARLGAFESRDAALRACTLIKKTRGYCAVTKLEGEFL